MQIKLATARGLGYTGDAAGLRDPNTNLTYGVKYLAGAYRAANGDHSRAMHYYASGYYYAAKRQRLARSASAGRTYPQPALVIVRPKRRPKTPPTPARQQVPTAASAVQIASRRPALTLPAIGLH